MKKIGFKNFKRFVDFPLMEYGPITFLVGRNNSGKSTLVQALLLINNYFKKDRIKLVDFENIFFDENNMLTYDRVKNNENENDDSISFTYQIEEIEIQFTISAIENRTWALVNELRIIDRLNGYSLHLNQNCMALIEKGGRFNEIKKDAAIESSKAINQEIEFIQDNLNKSKFKKSDKEYLSLIDRLNYLYKRIENIGNIETNPIENSISYSLDVAIDYHSADISEIPKNIINSLELWYHDSLNPKSRKEMDMDDDTDWLNSIKDAYQDRKNIEKFLKRFYDVVMNHSCEYVGAYSNKSRVLSFIKDKLNPLTQAINEYKDLEIDSDPGSPAFAFTRKWMKEFEIGDDFKIVMHAGEAFEFRIISNSFEIPLADKGRGSIQVMLLILKLAAVIAKNPIGTATILIEEPESNLHPALQSKLADMFLYVNDLHLKKQIRGKIEFIIETHSEYLIRKTQLLVKENEFEIKPNDNPFCVIYFDANLKQWKMNYREDGKFIEEFGKGFYDESSLLTLNLL